MKRLLVRRGVQRIWHFVNGVQVPGTHSWLIGDVSGLIGDVSGLRGDVSGLRGVIGECEIAEDERCRGIQIESLVR